ncbi:MAG: hypothetical protein R2838_18055 [Caldilineaceae bacterium]
MEGHLATEAVHDPAELPGWRTLSRAWSTRGARASTTTPSTRRWRVWRGRGRVGRHHVTQLSVSGLAEDFPCWWNCWQTGCAGPPSVGARRVAAQPDAGLPTGREQDTQRMAALRFYATMYADHVYGRPVSGYP